jgi:glycine/D-amino acid oxidase-like deaminating enzyme
MDIVVVGAGIVGAAVAFRLSASGARVTLVDAGPPAGGTSGATFAWINANSKGPFEYHFLNVCGMAEHLTLCRELGSDEWLQQGGNLEWAQGARADGALRAKVSRLRSWGYPVELLSRRDVSLLEPDVVVPDEVKGVAYFPTEGYVDVPPLVGALARAAQASGATVRPGVRVVALASRGERVTGVVTADGDRVMADWVISCVGHRTAEFARLAGVAVSVHGSPGLCAYSSPSTVGLRAIVHTPDISLRPDGAGRILMRAEEFDRGVGEDTPIHPLPAACDTLMARAAAILPGLAGARVETVRIGVRPMPVDGYPLVGPAPGRRGLYLVCTHSAVTLGPLIGRIVAQEILTDEVDARIAPFRADRLLSVAAGN